MEFPLWGWAVFGGVLLVMLGIDLFVHRGEHVDSRRAAILWSAVWIAVGLLFCVFVWVVFGGRPAQEYLAAYLIEKSLSLDNLFVFLVIFQTLVIPREHQRTVLSWGIFGALVFRALFIFLGAAAVERWVWVSYIFGAILLVTAWRLLRENPAEQKHNRTLEWLSNHLPVTHRTHGARFITHEQGRRVITPLFLALLTIEFTDITFAIDSVPAAFAVTREPFILYTSNAFAILGLRSLYVTLASLIAELKYLHFGLAAVLAFAGLKLLTAEWLHIPPLLSVGVIFVFIGIAVWASLRAPKGSGKTDLGVPLEPGPLIPRPSEDS